jgi:acetolactate synthase I/II/III large subunit
VRIADLLIVAGAPLGEVTTAANTLIESPVPRQKLVHIHSSADEIGRLHATRLGIVSGATAFADALHFIEPPAVKPWAALRRDLRSAFEASQRVTQRAETTNTVDLAQAVRHLSDTLPTDAIITNGAGNYSQFLHRYFTFKSYRTSAGPACGSMGYGLPAAIAAKLANPDRQVVCLAGDGCLMMTLPELATAVQYGLNIVIIIANNGLYGTIRMHQEQTYPGRVIGTRLMNPNFASLARSFGAWGERVERTQDFAAAFERACRASGPALLELALDPDAIAPGKTLSGLAPKTAS